VKGEELPLLGPGHGSELSSEHQLQFLWRRRGNCEERLLTEDPSALGYVDTGDEPSCFPGNILNLE
jgi:hypothetical protein